MACKPMGELAIGPRRLWGNAHQLPVAQAHPLRLGNEQGACKRKLRPPFVTP